MSTPIRDERETMRAPPLQERPIQERKPPENAPMQFQAPPHEEIEETDEQIATLSGVSSGAGKWLGILLVALGAFGGGAWYFLAWAPEQARLKAENEQKEWALKEKSRLDAETKVNAEAAAMKEAALRFDAGVVAAPLDAGVVAVAVVPVDAGVKAAVAAAAGEDGGKAAEPTRDYDYYLSQGDRLRDREKPEAALNAYSKAVELSPDRAEALAGRGLALIDMGKSEQGEAALLQALKVNKRYGPAIMGLAEAYRAMGQNDKALEYYQLYLERLPNGIEANVAKSNIERLKK